MTLKQTKVLKTHLRTNLLPELHWWWDWVSDCCGAVQSAIYSNCGMCHVSQSLITAKFTLIWQSSLPTFICVPFVSTVSPRDVTPKWLEQEERGPGDDNIVVYTHQERHHNAGKPHSCNKQGSTWKIPSGPGFLVGISRGIPFLCLGIPKEPKMDPTWQSYVSFTDLFPGDAQHFNFCVPNYFLA